MASIQLKPDCGNKGVPELKQDSHKTGAEFKALREASIAGEGSGAFLFCLICFYLL